VIDTDPTTLAFRARALAQAHALSGSAQRLMNRAVAEESRVQPRPEIGAWAGAAFTQGYCLRRVQEDGCDDLAAMKSDDDELDRAATERAAELRRGSADVVTIAALDLLVGSQVEQRMEPWRDELDEATWVELEQYLTWWVVKGYGLRVAETSGPTP